jgi:hypothetical protein
MGKAKTAYYEKSGLKFDIRTTTEVIITLSEDRAECIAHQLDVMLGGEVDEAEYGDLADFVKGLNEVTS